MQFAFTEDQLAITEAARAMLAETCTTASLRDMLKDRRALDEPRWRTICEMGLPGMLAPEAAGGMGLGLTDMVGIAEAAGYVGLPEPLVELAGITIPLLAGLADNRGLLDSALGGNFIALGHPANHLVANADSAVVQTVKSPCERSAVAPQSDRHLPRQPSCKNSLRHRNRRLGCRRQEHHCSCNAGAALALARSSQG